MENIYETVTARVVEALERGIVPWEKPWTGGEAGAPRNLVSKKPYRGMNVFVLGITSIVRGYSSPYWLTFNQAKDKGGGVRRGEKGTMVMYYNFKDVTVPDVDERGERRVDGEGRALYRTERKPIAASYYVFNLEQCEGVKTAEAAVVKTASDVSPIDAAESVIAGMIDRPTIVHDSAEAWYRHSTDTVNVPRMELFKTAGDYYSTMFHELTHATGHEKRLDRQGVTENDGFGGRKYSYEELVAEMGAAFLCATVGIENTIDNSAAYIQNWITRLKGDKRLAVMAAGAAQKAADHILGKNTGAEDK